MHQTSCACAGMCTCDCTHQMERTDRGLREDCFPFLYLPDSGKFLITFRKVKRLNKKKCNIGKQKTKEALNYNYLRKIEFIILLL